MNLREKSFAPANRQSMRAESLQKVNGYFASENFEGLFVGLESVKINLLEYNYLLPK